MRRIFLPCGLLLIAACSGGSATKPITVASVSLNESSATLVPQQSVTLVATTLDASGNALSGHAVTWMSSAPTVATVNTGGTVTAVAQGTTTITASSEGHSASATITVGPVPVATVTLNQSTGTIVPNQTLNLSATMKDAAGTTLTGRTVAWSTSAAATATVDNNGVVTGAAAGSVTITATSETRSASATITVAPGGFVTAAGGSASGYGTVTVTVPAGAVAAGTAITITPTPSPGSDPTLAAGTAYDFGPAGTAFAVPVTLAITYNPATLTAGTNQTLLRVARLVGATWTPLAGSTVNTGTHVATGTTSSFSTYAVIAVPDPAPALLEQRVLAQQGLAVAMASTVLQSQFEVLFTATSSNLACQVATDGSSYRKTAGGTTPPMDISVYFDGACSRPYMQEHVTVYSSNAGLSHIVAVATYFGPTGTTLGTTAFDETSNLSVVNSFITGSIYGLGTFTPANGAPNVSLGLNCALGTLSMPCQGGIVQNLPALSVAIGSVTSIVVTVDTTGKTPVTFAGTSVLTSGTLGSLTLTAPQSLSLVVQGGTQYGTTSDSGSEATFSLFPPTPTGWSVIDTGHDQNFTINVASNTVRNLVGSLTRISTGAVLATIALDQSGTGTITYSDGTVAAITNWTLSQ